MFGTVTDITTILEFQSSLVVPIPKVSVETKTTFFTLIILSTYNILLRLLYRTIWALFGLKTRFRAGTGKPVCSYELIATEFKNFSCHIWQCL